MSDRDTKAKEYDAVVSGLRDEPCAFKRQCFRDGWDAAIAALPDMVKPLEWGKASETKWLAGDYQINEHSLGEFVLTCKGRCIGVRSGGAAFRFSKAAAQAHHTAAILSAFGVQGGEA